MVGDQTLLAGLPTSMTAPGSSPGSGATLEPPALRSLTVTGDLDPLVSLAITGEASDERVRGEAGGRRARAWSRWRRSRRRRSRSCSSSRRR